MKLKILTIVTVAAMVCVAFLESYKLVMAGGYQPVQFKLHLQQ